MQDSMIVFNFQGEMNLFLIQFEYWWHFIIFSFFINDPGILEMIDYLLRISEDILNIQEK